MECVCISDVKCILQDKVNISVAIIPMAQDFGWSPTVSGLVQSSFFYGYALTQIPGGYVTSQDRGQEGASQQASASGLQLRQLFPSWQGTIPGARSFQSVAVHKSCQEENLCPSLPQGFCS